VIRPTSLRSGDKVAIVAPASPFRRDELDRGVAEIAALGFEPVYDDSLFDAAGYVAGSPAVRAAALQRAWEDPSIRGIIAVRGGYGSAQLLPLLDGHAIRKARTVFVGYSDITALLWLHVQQGIVAFHGPMLEGRLARGVDGYDRRSFLDAVTKPAPLGELAPEGLETLWPGEASGLLVGGTIAQLVSLMGTPWAFTPPRGSVLFLEDVGERPYRLDRMLTQLDQSGVLASASALVFGVFPKCDEPGGAFRARDVIRAATAPLGVPVLFGFPSGHTPGRTWTLPFGVRARVVGAPRPMLVIEEAAVE
jgi:muramoyltetrapeptide carboxypeptidase